MTLRGKSLSIIQRVCDKHCVDLDLVMGRSRLQHISRARQEAYFCLRNERNLTFPQIGRIFDRCHTTVLSGVGAHASRGNDSLKVLSLTERRERRRSEKRKRRLAVSQKRKDEAAGRTAALIARFSSSEREIMRCLILEQAEGRIGVLNTLRPFGYTDRECMAIEAALVPELTGLVEGRRQMVARGVLTSTRRQEPARVATPRRIKTCSRFIVSERRYCEERRAMGDLCIGHHLDLNCPGISPLERRAVERTLLEQAA